MNITVKRAAYLPARGLDDAVRLDQFVAACLGGQDRAGRMAVSVESATSVPARGLADFGDVVPRTTTGCRG